jgi:hypothetical protein
MQRMSMMKFKQFLIETSATEDRILNEIIKNVDPTYLKNFLNNNKGNKIYRGRGSHGHVVIHTPPKKRKSANTTNEFTLTVDNFLPSWKQFPKRSQSFICATDSFIAENYGYVYRVLPFGNPEIGICSDSDIWISFKDAEKYSFQGNGVVQGYNNALDQISNVLFNREDNLESVSNLRKLFNSIDKLILSKSPKLDEAIKKLIQGTHRKSGPSGDPDDEPSFGPTLEDEDNGELAGQMLIMAKQEKSMVNGIDKLFGTNRNNFKKMTPNELFNAGAPYHIREVWMSCKCAFILESSVTLIQGRMKFLMGK